MLGAICRNNRLSALGKEREAKWSLASTIKYFYMHPKVLPPLSPLAKTVVMNGLYEHYKGLHYKILAIARHSETLEELVVYQALYGEKEVWIRPLAMFLENVTIDGKSQSRFKLVQ